MDIGHLERGVAFGDALGPTRTVALCRAGVACAEHFSAPWKAQVSATVGMLTEHTHKARVGAGVATFRIPVLVGRENDFKCSVETTL